MNRARRFVWTAALAASGVTAPATTDARADAPRSSADAPRSDDRPTAQTVRIEVSGAMAHVTVTRSLPCAEGFGEPREDRILDLALPARSSLLGVEVSARGRALATRPTTLASARDAYLESLRGPDIGAARVPFESETGFRIRTACLGDNPHDVITIKYNFSTSLEIQDGRAQLAFPPSPELSPPAVRVEVRLEPPPSGAREIWIAGAVHRLLPGGAALATDTVSMRARWSVAVGPLGGAEHDRARAVALASTPTGGARGRGEPNVAYAVGLVPGAPQPLPDRALFLVDRSRSVGAGGLEAERDIARRVLDALPPSTRFDALFFDRGQKRLFPVARAATREAMSAFDDEMVPERLANGTDLVAAVRVAGELLRREASELGPRALLVVLSDGAFAGSAATAHGVVEALGPLPGVELLTAAISVRANDDSPVSDDDRRVLRALAAAAALGGVERTIRTGEIGDAVPALLESLRAGGEITSVQIGGSGPMNAVAETIAPGGGASGVIASAPSLPLTVTYHAQGQLRRLTVRPTRVDARWLPRPRAGAGAAAGAAAGTLDARLLLGPPVTALVEPVIRPREVSDPAADGPRGFLERSVVRDALSLAFTPRARACYLNRSARTQADRDLAGRVRLALDLVRGEVGAARIEASTLSHPTIENCLRDAAFALDVPRAYRNDTPVTAVLNLVFRPRTPERKREIENPALDRELDLLVEAALKESSPADAPDPPASPPAPSVTPAAER